MNTYFNWFKSLINVLINILFVGAIISTLFVFTSGFTGIIRIILFIVVILAYIGIVYLFKEKVINVINKIENKISKLDTKYMLIIIAVVMILLKAIYTIFFYFDATTDGDIQIYLNIANQIVETGIIRSDAISHLFGTAIHFAVFEYLHIPIHIGMFIVFLIGTLINFISFKSIMGKEKSFMVIMLYILMPSSTLLTFCPTHEVFLYMYLSIFIFALNMLLSDRSILINIIYSLICILSSILSILVNPSGYICFVILGLVALLSKIRINKRIVIVVVLVLSIFGSNSLSKTLEVNEHTTTMNTYTILIHGSNPESLGEQVDGYPLNQILGYIFENTNDFSDRGYEEAAKIVLFGQYKYLFTHPLNLIRLIANKFYILWSGNHYSIEMAYVFNGINTIAYYAMLVISTLIYLFVLTINVISSKNKQDNIYVSNYKLAILGCFAITMLSIVTNKYSLYVTLFIYLISFYKIDIDENK